MKKIGIASIVLILLLAAGIAWAAPSLTAPVTNVTFPAFSDVVTVASTITDVGWGGYGGLDISDASASGGIATNMTQDGQTCCWVSICTGGTGQCASLINSSGKNTVAWTSLTSADHGAGVWTNASGTVITDMWFWDYYNWKMYHMNTSGLAVDSDDGNFTFDKVGRKTYGIWANSSTPAGRHWFMRDVDTGKIFILNNSGYNVENITVAAGIGITYGITSNDTNRPPNNFWLVNNTTGVVYHINSAGVLLDSYVGNNSANVAFKSIAVYPVAASVNQTFVTGSDLRYLYFSGLSGLFGKLNYTWIETNETGALKNGSLYVPLNNTNVTTLIFNWTNSSIGCNKAISFKFYSNSSSSGDTGSSATAVRVFLPYVVSEPGAAVNISSVSCADKNSANISWTGSGKENVTMNMSYYNTSGVKVCGYYAVNADRMKIFNYTDNCMLVINTSTVNSTVRLDVYASIRVTTVKPGGLPAALTAAAVGTVLVIYAVVRRRKRVSWG